MSNLKTVLEQLTNGGVKDRQEALNSIRTIFAQDDVVARFHINRKGNAEPLMWLPVFQALYSTVLVEKQACTKAESKATAAARQRAAKAAGTIRWLTERTVTLLDGRVTQSLFDHLINTMIHSGGLFAPVALDYIKGLKCLASYAPHVEWMKDTTWVKLVEMGFNVIIGDPIRKSFWEDDVPTAASREVEDDDLYQGEDDPDEEQSSPSLNKRKRQREKVRRSRAEVQASASPSSSRSTRRIAPSLEQIEFTSLLAILLRSPSAPILTYLYDEEDTNNRLASSILDRLKRILFLHPRDSSLVPDYLSLLHSTLSHLALNKRQEIDTFSRASWDGLVGLWGMKDKRLKEGLVAVLRGLFPFVASEDLYNHTSAYDCIEGINHLWSLLHGEADSKWGVDGLSFESIRLQLRDEKTNESKNHGSFSTQTFSAGWNFDANQALTWAILELQADCAAKLYHYSESAHPQTSTRTLEKRVKLLRNPIISLLSSIKASLSTTVRIYHLQMLLFFIERHWHILHASLRQETVDVLFQFISYEDGSIQSWVLLCMAAVACAESTRIPLSSDSTLDVINWESIFSHAIRRLNVPLVSRAACHTAHVLLALSQVEPYATPRLHIASQRVLSEIETLAKDLDVQGPLFPYDSVCMFLAHCLRVASQDVRLYRMHLEDKVLSWLVDNWKLTGFGKGRMPLYRVTDVLLLLESICSFTKKSDFLLSTLLPNTLIVHTLIEEERSRVIREFLLDATLPVFKEPSNKLEEPILSDHQDFDLVQPRGRERKISTFFQRSLEAISGEWEMVKDDHIRLTAETARRSLDLAVTALAFESLLIANGIHSSRHVSQAAAKLIASVTLGLRDAPWTIAEKTLITLGLEPLIAFGGNDREILPWEAMLAPNLGTGIRKHILHRLTSQNAAMQDLRAARRTEFLRILWQINDVQDLFFGNITTTLRDIIRTMLGEVTNSTGPRSPMAIDDKDDFGPIRTSSQQSLDLAGSGDSEFFVRHILDVCLGFLTIGPSLRSASGEPTRDKELMDLVLKCAESRPEKFLVVCPLVLIKMRQRVLYLSENTLDSLLNALSRPLSLYAYAKNGHLHLVTIQALHSTINFWLTEQISTGEVSSKIRQLCSWLSTALQKKKLRTWWTRDAFACFLGEYIERDPQQHAWSLENDDSDESENAENLPTDLLMLMNSDEDVRVRFRMAVLTGQLFNISRRLGYDPLVMYDNVRKHYTTQIDSFEHMITRMLSLGNIMVVSSAVRRGAYWHILETCFFSKRYHCHIETILRSVSQRMGLNKFSQLFEAYASQLAYSVCQLDGDIHQIAPNLLGYRDRLECAQSIFRSFTPANIVERPNLFKQHCAVLNKPLNQGIQECFGDVICLLIVMWMAEPTYSTNDGLENYLREHTDMDEATFDEVFRSNADSIISSVLRALGDQDASVEGPIVAALRAFDSTGGSVHVFKSLTRFRSLDDFNPHPPNLPAHPTNVVLKALDWVVSRVPEAGGKATMYHVLHELLASVQSSSLVNEQFRLINALTLWIALHHSDFKDLTLLHTLVHGATAMLAQSDLARAAQSWLDWAFRRYTKDKLKDKRLSNILTRIACYANEHARNTQDTVIASIGSDILQWIDAQLINLEEVDIRNSNGYGQIFHSQILKALPAWPREPSPQLGKLFKGINSETLSNYLNDRRNVTNKFRMVRRLRDQAETGDGSMVRFGKSDFWRLKECIPPPDHLQVEDVDAFATLLYLNQGQIDSFSVEQQLSDSMRTIHKKAVKTHGTKGEGVTQTQDLILSAARDAVISTLLSMLDSEEATQAHLAYQTIRWVTSVIDPGAFSTQTWLPEFRDEMEYLQQYKRVPRFIKNRTLAELHESETFTDSAHCFAQWISSLTALIADILAETDAFYAQLIPLLESDANFAEQILPIVVHTLIRLESNSGQETSKSLLSKYFTVILSLNMVDVSCIRSVIDVVLHLRQFSPGTHDALAYNKWLDLDYSLLARKALKCGAYTTALLFLELASEFKRPTEEETLVEEVLYEIYNNIDEPDGFYGIKSHNLRRFLIKRFHHEKQWDQAFRFHGAALEAGSTETNEAEGLVKAFHSFGFDQLAIDTLRSSPIMINGALSSSAMNYRLGWRTETWDLPDRMENTPGASLYHSLRSLYRERDPRSVDRIVRSSLQEEVLRLRSLGSENLAQIREVVQDIMCLGQIQKLKLPSTQESLSLKDVNSGQCQWDTLVTVADGFDFSDFESIMATRLSLIRSTRQKEERQQIGNMTTPFTRTLIDIEKKCLVRLSEAAREADQIQVALNAVVRAQRLEHSATFDVSQEFANVLWVQKEEKLAVEFLRTLLEGPDDKESKDAGRRAALLACLGAWTAEACLEKPTEIKEQFFDPAVSMLQHEAAVSSATRATIFHQYAVFSERQYNAIVKSPDNIRLKVYLQRKQQEVDFRDQELRRTQGTIKANTLKADQERARKLLKQDTEKYHEHEQGRITFLKQAINMYARCLEVSDNFDGDAPIRLCSLWFANFDEESDVASEVELALKRVPSRKMVFLAHQLSARLSTLTSGEMSLNQLSLQRLVLRMCREHPFHSLYQVYCLQADHLMASGRRQPGRHSTPLSQTERIAAASEIFQRLRQDEVTSQRLRDVEFLCKACLEWATYPVVKNPRFEVKKKKTFKIPDEVMLLKVHEQNPKLKVPVMTYHTPIDPSMKYDQCVWVERYDAIFETAGGINLPKITTCLGSDGQKYKQLFKGEGNDDLRQDAVMEQVFDLVNNVLRHDRETRRRNLKIRGYKVVPLSSHAGILEFVTNTSPLREFLSIAHTRYRPQDQKAPVLTKELQHAQQEFATQPAKLVTRFKELMKQLQPVMRHYFTERHKTPIAWFAMRLNYTRSVATSSIVGHILGLGDRHTSNILMDNKTGEVVHIDLGIAFEQGKLLPIPERVPFRLTRDVIDGMGTSGTQGVFQRCAEETLRVLREDSEIIMTVLEVFKHDPLHSWSASELKIQRVQQDMPSGLHATIHDTNRFNLGIGIDMSSGTAEEAADRALSSVARKLDKSLSVQCTVNELIAEATDLLNLASIFHGWQPFY
ncbi:hypothetical protein AMATHDRAFT_41011 [Amanita thiersii Skay4041]|uniref:Serine/threonine-protein kinase Tel1 n=1 Tax=Amanita thiersii Skay4041 TaxID=703135 RepID=A0A2A9NRH1_9AGAR|nr:hypothetical protein AMATHDRAFT_41011 [Amanita thiersii Skay4041]